ncbi:hypothetical protein UY3_15332 [Chelonia mydas]|uniref:Uncharacterized protein n=1 Tax=Chelonia mydas TaxID=8469 RepID=M7AWW8_CHEMY|nr:hypothetical protein UY3_15332 [Chelonia mydas]
MRKPWLYRKSEPSSAAGSSLGTSQQPAGHQPFKAAHGLFCPGRAQPSLGYGELGRSDWPARSGHPSVLPMSPRPNRQEPSFSSPGLPSCHSPVDASPSHPAAPAVPSRGLP